MPANCTLTEMRTMRMRFSQLCAVVFAIAFSSMLPATAHADGVSAVKACEADTSRPEDTARLSLLPNGEARGSDTAADLIKVARQKAKEGKDAAAVQWAALCQFEDKAEQDAIKRDAVAVLNYLKQ